METVGTEAWRWMNFGNGSHGVRLTWTWKVQGRRTHEKGPWGPGLEGPGGHEEALEI